nr:cyclin-A1-4-like isoform X2 [Ipomoea trifida]
MATTAQTRRSSSASNAAAKRQAAAAAENRHGKVAAAVEQRLAHKRPALTNITNQRTGSLLSSRSTFSESSGIVCSLSPSFFLVIAFSFPCRFRFLMYRGM